MKGISPALAVVAMLVFVLVIAGALIWYQQQLALFRMPAITYDGEFDDVFLATKGPFYSDFSEQVDCNITNDVVGGTDYSSCIYRTTKALNATADSSVNGRNWVIALVLDIDGPVEKIKVSGKLGNGVASTLDAANDMVILPEAMGYKLGLYTHEDDPKLIADFSNAIEDQIEIDAEFGPITKGDEYVLWLPLYSKTISPDATTGDDIMRLEIELDTDGDVDTAHITLESA